MNQPTFEPTWDSLKQYTCPDWFRDAKFGIWAHWGPQCGPMVGDWYARNMYTQGHQQYEHHCRTYGHPSKFGYKDIIELWKGERFDPEALIDLYKKAGARYFISMGVHHDNFDLWNSKHHRWNAVNFGPHRDIVGAWKKAAEAAGLRFGVTEHLERCWSWFNTNKGRDAYGPYAGVPYDGNDPAYEDLYFPQHDDTSPAYPANPPEMWTQGWLKRIQDLVDAYEPDLLYSDGAVPFGEVGRQLVAHFYNVNMARHGGKLEAVYNLKDMREHDARTGRSHGDYVEGIGVRDMERGVIDGICDTPWQTDTCIGRWFYDSRRTYKTPTQVVRLLVDIVSKNGNLLLNVTQRPDGTLDEIAEWTVREIGSWMDVNSEAIYGTRPWHQYSEGPTQLATGHFAEEEKRDFTAQDFRFTTKGNTLYAIALGWPEQEWLVKSLAGKDVKDVAVLGCAAPPEWSMTPEGLRVARPATQPCHTAWGLRIQLG
jgi:alpha-L-fucosidase